MHQTLTTLLSAGLAVKNLSITFPNVTTVAKSHYTIAELNDEASEHSRENVYHNTRYKGHAHARTHTQTAEIKIVDLKNVLILQ